VINHYRFLANLASLQHYWQKMTIHHKTNSYIRNFYLFLCQYVYSICELSRLFNPCYECFRVKKAVNDMLRLPASSRASVRRESNQGVRMRKQGGMHNILLMNLSRQIVVPGKLPCSLPEAFYLIRRPHLG